jgi:hypothetical protein
MNDAIGPGSGGVRPFLIRLHQALGHLTPAERLASVGVSMGDGRGGRVHVLAPPNGNGYCPAHARAKSAHDRDAPRHSPPAFKGGTVRLGRKRHGSGRFLTTVLFVDIVGSTELASAIGDAAWQSLLRRYFAAVRDLLKRFGGRQIDTAGDGLFAAFDAPADAITCALAIRDAAISLGIRTRAGLHMGEAQAIEGKVGGIAVHIGARIAGAAGPVRCWSRGRSRIWSRARDSGLKIVGTPHSRASRSHGASISHCHHSPSRRHRPPNQTPRLTTRAFGNGRSSSG